MSGDRPLDGQVAIVVGAARRRSIGRATALVLAASGAAVALVDVETAGVAHSGEADDPDAAAGWRGLPSLVEEIRARGGTATSATGDVSREADAARIVDVVTAELGRVDILFNNAAAPIGRDRAVLWEVPPDAFARSWA